MLKPRLGASKHGTQLPLLSWDSQHRDVRSSPVQLTVLMHVEQKEQRRNIFNHSLTGHSDSKMVSFTDLGEKGLYEVQVFITQFKLQKNQIDTTI